MTAAESIRPGDYVALDHSAGLPWRVIRILRPGRVRIRSVGRELMIVSWDTASLRRVDRPALKQRKGRVRA